MRWWCILLAAVVAFVLFVQGEARGKCTRLSTVAVRRMAAHGYRVTPCVAAAATTTITTTTTTNIAATTTTSEQTTGENDQMGLTTTNIAATTTTSEQTTGEDDQMGLAVISYWLPSSGDFDSLPDGSLAIVNPMSGVFADQSTETLATGINQFQVVVANAAARGIKMLGYVPAGYFNHGCNINGQCQTMGRISKQVEKYFELFPGLAGIFFDEVSPQTWDCSAFVPEYAQLRQLVSNHSSGAKIAWNAGSPSQCAVDGANTGEILVLFEGAVDRYGTTYEASYGTVDYDALLTVTASSARAKGVETWHMVYSVNASQLAAVLQRARHYRADLFYATDIGGDWQNGENTWGSPPAYWDQLRKEFGWTPASTTTTTLIVPNELSATVVPSEILAGASAAIKLGRPATLCCSAWDWVGIYAKGSTARLGFVHSHDAETNTVTLLLDTVLANRSAGEYTFKYSTDVDNWVVHDLEPATLKIHSEPFATIEPSTVSANSPAATLTLGRPSAQCCSSWDWVGIYAKGYPLTRLAYVHSSNDKANMVELALGAAIANLGVGEYEFKYSTEVDGWTVHDLRSVTLRIV